MRTNKIRALICDVLALVFLTLAIPVLADPALQFNATAALLGGVGTRDLDNQASYLATTVEGEAAFFAGAWRGDFLGTLDQTLITDAERTDAAIREARLSWRSDSWFAALGRQRLAWGRADEINPTDVLTPRDLDRPALWASEEYAGVDALSLGWRLGEERTISAFLLPHFRSGRLPRGLWEGVPLAGESHATSSRNPGFALRFETLGSGYDMSVTALYSADLTPYLRPTAGGAAFQRRYGELYMFGADFSATVDRSVIRGEVAYLHRENDRYGLALGSTATAVFGLERELGDQVTMIGQLLYENHASLPRNSGMFGAAGMFNRALFHQTSHSFVGATVSAVLRPESYVGSLTLSVAAFENGERMFRVRGQYPIGQTMKLELLSEHYTGPGGTSFGLLRENSILWLRLTANFHPQ